MKVESTNRLWLSVVSSSQEQLRSIKEKVTNETGTNRGIQKIIFKEFLIIKKTNNHFTFSNEKTGFSSGLERLAPGSSPGEAVSTHFKPIFSGCLFQ